MFSANQIIAHCVGDFLLQSHWMATEKVRNSFAAAVHALVYSLPFLLLTQSPLALAIICGTHFVIDRWRLARFFIFAKNGFRGNYRTNGFPDDVPVWMSTWLFILTDNIIHILINGSALWLVTP